MRKATPRLNISAGSVGIAGHQFKKGGPTFVKVTHLLIR
ncbi:hypothetical protein [Tigheibacillus jepli]